MLSLADTAAAITAPELALAWLLATHPDSDARNGAEAVNLARRARGTRKRLVQGVSERRNVAHLAPAPRLGLAIEVQLHARHGAGRGPFSQLSALARMRAAVVLPTPRGPAKR